MLQQQTEGLRVATTRSFDEWRRCFRLCIDIRPRPNKLTHNVRIARTTGDHEHGASVLLLSGVHIGARLDECGNDFLTVPIHQPHVCRPMQGRPGALIFRVNVKTSR